MQAASTNPSNFTVTPLLHLYHQNPYLPAVDSRGRKDCCPSPKPSVAPSSSFPLFCPAFFRFLQICSQESGLKQFARLITKYFPEVASPSNPKTQTEMILVVFQLVSAKLDCGVGIASIFAQLICLYGMTRTVFVAV